MSAARRGRIIALEGLDGCGKSTLAADLADRFGAVALTTPDASMRPLRDLVDRAPAGPAKWVFYASTVIEGGRRARALSDAGRVVIIDRYWASTLAYALFEGGAAHRDEVLAVLCPLERWVVAVDETWWIEVPDDLRAERLARRGASEGDRASLAAPAALRAAYAVALSRPVSGVVREVDGTRADDWRGLEL